MEALILNKKFQTLAIIDAYSSLIWTDRYDEPGDFEIDIPISNTPIDAVAEDNYIWIKDSDRLQIIENISIITDSEDGDHMIFDGRSLESILERRYVYFHEDIDLEFQEGLRKLFNENAINPSDTKRKISKLRFIWNDDPRLSELSLVGDYFGYSLLDITQTYCQLYGLGFKIIYNEDEDTFDFSLYYGEDRSYDQEKNVWVVFSDKYENLINSNYFESHKNLKTAAIISSDEDEIYGRELVDVDQYPGMTGLNRRELYVEANDIRWPSIEVDEDAIREQYPGSSEEYINSMIEEAWEKEELNARKTLRDQLEQRVKEELAKTYITKTFEGTIEAVQQYVYGRDFFIGDIVQVRNKYGKEAVSRVSEVVRSYDKEGEIITPTFTTLFGLDNQGDITNPEL